MKNTHEGRVERLRFPALAAAACAALLAVTSPCAAAGGSWTPLANLPAVNSIQLMILMTDGSVMVHTFDDIQTWVRLTPDAKGSYVNGTWTTLGKMITPRLYYASQVLPNGKLWVMGGEYTGPYFDSNWGSQAEIYDPLNNRWTEVAGYPQQKCFPVPVTSDANLTAGSAAVSGLYSTYRILPGWSVSGAGIPPQATVVTVDNRSRVTLSAKATASGPAVVQFSGIPASCFGDDPSILVPGRQILAGNLLNSTTYLYSIADNAFTQTGSKVYKDSSDEEGWAVLPSGRVLTYDLFQSIKTGTGYAETYGPKTGAWKSISPADGTAGGTLPVLSDPQVGYELGPVIRLLDGRVLVIGANPHTALYSPSSNSWAAGPDMIANLTGPGGTIANALFGADDAAAAILPNGHVFLTADPGPNPVALGARTHAGSASVQLPTTAGLQSTWSVAQADGKNTVIPPGAVIYSVDSPTSITLGTYDASGNLAVIDALRSRPDIPLVLGGVFSSPTQLFDFDPRAGTMTPIAGPANSLLPTEGAYVTRMLVLPTGQLLLSDSSNQLYVYTPNGSAPATLRPVVTDVDYRGNGVFRLRGLKLNGQSAGASYGDDDQMNENYPIVRLQDPATGNVWYCRTTNWDSVAVGGQEPQSVDFTLNPAVTAGTYDLVVVGAGIASQAYRIRITGDELAPEDAAALTASTGATAAATPARPLRMPPPLHRPRT